jgi:hypothetical protein
MEWAAARLAGADRLRFAEAWAVPLLSFTPQVTAGAWAGTLLLRGAGPVPRCQDAYLRGPEQAAAAGRDLSAIRSVASFFISPVDSEVDSRLDRIAAFRRHGHTGRNRGLP